MRILIAFLMVPFLALADCPPTPTPTTPPSCTGSSTPLPPSGTTVYPIVPAGRSVSYAMPPFADSDAQHRYYLFTVAHDNTTGSLVTMQLTVSQCPGGPALPGCSIARVIGGGFGIQVSAGIGSSCFVATSAQAYLNVSFPNLPKTGTSIVNMNSLYSQTPLK